MSRSEFRTLLAQGAVTKALMVAPFGYRSSSLGNGFRFVIESGPMKGQTGEGSTLLDAVRAATISPAPLTDKAQLEIAEGTPLSQHQLDR